MNKKEMLKALIDHYAHGKKTLFASKVGVTPQAISTWLSRSTFDSELVFAKCEYLNPEWLLTGKGEMLREKLTENNKASDCGVEYYSGSAKFLNDQLADKKVQIIELKEQIKYQREHINKLLDLLEKKIDEENNSHADDRFPVAR